VTQRVNVSVFADVFQPFGNGVNIHVFQNGSEKLVYTLASSRERWDALTLDVQAGDTVDFVVDPNDSNDLNDSTVLTAVIY
jgi:hypothetical protein